MMSVSWDNLHSEMWPTAPYVFPKSRDFYFFLIKILRGLWNISLPFKKPGLGSAPCVLPTPPHGELGRER